MRCSEGAQGPCTHPAYIYDIYYSKYINDEVEHCVVTHIAQKRMSSYKIMILLTEYKKRKRQQTPTTVGTKMMLVV